MPEGDTLHKVAAFMRPRMLHTRCIQAHAAQQRLPILQQRCITDVRAVGKHLLIDLAPAPSGYDAAELWHLRVHLGMHGSWHAYRCDEPWQRPKWQASVSLTTSAQEVFVCFNADDVELISGAALQTKSPIARLGPNLLGETCDVDAIVAQTRRRAPSTPLVDTLLDQSVAAGLGNVYKSELLFIFGLHPLTASQSITDAVMGEIFRRGRALMQQNLGGWPRTTTYDPRLNPPGRMAKKPRLFVYLRKAEPCLRCATPIQRALMGRNRRSTYWCPSCQPERLQPTS
jgi:endonuclease-8